MNYRIKQITVKSYNDNGVQYAFMSHEYAMEHGFSLNDYSVVFTDSIRFSNSIEETLEKIFRNLNTVNLPRDFYGHTLSVSDIIEVTIDGKKFNYYIDFVGFKLVE